MHSRGWLFVREARAAGKKPWILADAYVASGPGRELPRALRDACREAHDERVARDVARLCDGLAEMLVRTDAYPSQYRHYRRGPCAGGTFWFAETAHGLMREDLDLHYDAVSNRARLVAETVATCRVWWRLGGSMRYRLSASVWFDAATTPIPRPREVAEYEEGPDGRPWPTGGSRPATVVEVYVW